METKTFEQIKKSETFEKLNSFQLANQKGGYQQSDYWTVYQNSAGVSYSRVRYVHEGTYSPYVAEDGKTYGEPYGGGLIIQI